MNLSGRRDERVHRMNNPATRFAPCYKAAPLVGDGPINSDYSRVESQRQLTAKPFIEPPAPGTRGQAFYAVPQLGERYNTEEDFAFVDSS